MQHPKNAMVFFFLLMINFSSFANFDYHFGDKHLKDLFVNYNSLEGTNGCTESHGFDLNYLPFKRYHRTTSIRTGILKTKSSVVKGNIMYLEGLGDSMMNHAKLFRSLNEAGYNIITFDYMGQGCSSGTMNHTTIDNIIKLSSKVWDFYVKSDEKINLIGWSTGGLAAYKFAKDYQSKINSIALIAPGIAPRLLIGDNMQITTETLTQNDFNLQINPHIDPIKPTSPLHVPVFALNLQGVAALSRHWNISPNVKGYVFLSDETDTYVDPVKTIEVLENHASHFGYRFYKGTGALHEIDNELEPIASDLRRQMKDFFYSSIQK